jgi:hypothetical protein
MPMMYTCILLDLVLIIVGRQSDWLPSHCYPSPGSNIQSIFTSGPVSSGNVHSDSFVGFGSQHRDMGDDDKHILVPNAGLKNKMCVYCHKLKSRTKSGWYIYTQNRCRKCDVPLCKKNKTCFVNYHRELGIPESEFMTPYLNFRYMFQ